ncbi:MAG: HEAT repeat domain-containing protein, partial [Cyanobacteriota bacterium]|nr:HEAT repeat domain-containing protein [Cyanobacteriota bacterium]
MSENQPREFDAVLGGKNPAPSTAAVLGGIEGVKRRLESEDEYVLFKALSDALNYQEAGLDLVIQSLHSDSKTIQRSAYNVLRKRKEPQVKQALRDYQPWYLFEPLQGYCRQYGGGYFANRKVLDFNPG